MERLQVGMLQAIEDAVGNRLVIFYNENAHSSIVPRSVQRAYPILVIESFLDVSWMSEGNTFTREFVQ